MLRLFLCVAVIRVDTVSYVVVVAVSATTVMIGFNVGVASAVYSMYVLFVFFISVSAII